jgi:hypothetical protein
MTGSLKILILGGYGTFGGRLARLLADVSALTLIVAGRSHATADAFCATLPPGAARTPLPFDRDGDVERQLRVVAPDIVVDASGPFQTYGDDPYRVVKACLAQGCNYLDLADGSAFVTGITQFDAQARACGLFILSGVSSFPVLTAAVVRRLSQEMARVDSIAAGIAPSPYAGVGANVIRAIASYAGKPIVRMQDGHRQVRYGLIESRYHTIGPPGRLPLPRIRFSLVDVPDLAVLADLWPSATSIWMGAGPVPAILHRALSLIAWTVRVRLVPSLLPLAGLMHRTINVIRWGEHRGGMFVSVAGVGHDGQAIARSWEMLAEGDDGPLIPSMAAEAIIRHWLGDRRPTAGARPAVNDLELTDYEELFRRRAIVTGVWTTPAPASASLYRRVLGDAWALLPAPIQAMHNVDHDLTAEGLAEVQRGHGFLSRMLAGLIGFPQAGKDIPVTVRFRAQEGSEQWTRTFAGRSFASTQWQGGGAFDRLLCERFGPVTVGLALLIEEGRLRFVVRRWHLFGIPLPRSWAPRGDAYETVQDDRFVFHVEISHPLTGLLVRYRGWLVRRG